MSTATDTMESRFSLVSVDLSEMLGTRNPMASVQMAMIMLMIRVTISRYIERSFIDHLMLNVGEAGEVFCVARVLA